MNLQQLPRPIEMPVEPSRDWFDNEEGYTRALKKYEKDLEEAEFWKFYEIRDIFISEDLDNRSIVALDFDNLEMKLLAHFSEDEGLVQAFKEGLDAHGDTAVRMFKLDCTAGECKKKYPHLRQISKTINFLLMYGGGASTLFETLSAQDALDENGEPITKEKAQEYYDLYFEAYPGVTEFIKNQKKFAHKFEYIVTLMGRIGKLSGINGSNYGDVAYNERLSVNRTIQGSGADIAMLCQVAIDNDERLRELDVKLLLQIHDELVLDMPDSSIDEAIPIIKNYMEHAFPRELNVPITISWDKGKSYAEAK